MKIYKYITFTILILTAFPVLVKAQNLALHKTYTLSELPNYQYSAPSSDKTSLTDGIYTKGYFWLQTTTLGWTGTSVSVDIDLGSIQPVGEVALNTVRSIDASISFPENIYVFISNDNKNFKYVGDAADTSANSPGPYEIKKFFLKDINATARYVICSVVPEGSYFFCDEIEVLKGIPGNKLDTAMLISKDSLNEAVDSLKTRDFNGKLLVQSVSNLLSVSNDSREAKQYSDINIQLQNKNLSNYDLQSYEIKVRKLHASNLKRKYNVPLIVEKYNPWDTLSQLHEPKGNAKGLDYQFTALINSTQYGCFLLTNTNSSSQQVAFKVSNNNPSITNIELFEVPYVPSINYTRIPDPLIAVTNDISMYPGISQMFIFRISGVESGSTKSIISVQSGGVSRKININTKVEDIVSNQTRNNINGNVWAYFNNPMLKDCRAQAVEDLSLHHINTLAVPPVILPNMETSDYGNFVNYLEGLKSAKNILLFMDYASVSRKNGYKNGQFMSAEWKNHFIVWYNKMIKLIHEKCSQSAQIYLYPYDEVATRNIKDFKQLILWARETNPGIKFYATLNTQESIDSLLSFVDIAQTLPSLASRKLPAHHCEIWIYTGNTPSRALSPYGFYRLMAWDAFVNDYKGIGFWNYADERNGGKLNLISGSTFNPAGSYSVIYNNPDGSIISSRRWEAFRLGIEDYSIIQLYANKFGINKAKLLVNEVLSNPADLNKADSIRNEMISSITAHK